MVLAKRDMISLPWQAVWAARAVSMTDIEEGRLGWADSTQWSLNCISNSQLALLNSLNVSTSGQKTRICHCFSMSVPVHHGLYKHFCVPYCKTDFLCCTQNAGAKDRRHQYPSWDLVDHSSSPLTSWCGASEHT